MTAVSTPALEVFLNELGYPIRMFANLPTLTTVACGSVAYPFIRCNESAKPILSIENLPLSGTINGQLFKDMGNVWAGLNLVNTSLSGTIPSELFQSPVLSFLRLNNNLLTGTLPTDVSGDAAIQEVLLQRNRLSGTIPSAYLTQLTAIVRLYFGENQFSGSLPAVSAFAPNLDVFYANNNNLSGNLPSTLSAWTKSGKWFSVAANRLSGTLPDGLFASPNSFDFFRVDDNQLHGSIPSEISSQSALQRLNLSHNSFSGELTLPAVDECFVDNNLFSGCSQPSGGDCCNGTALSSQPPAPTIHTTTIAIGSEATATTASVVSGIDESTTVWQLNTSASTAPSAPMPVSDRGDSAIMIGGIVGGVVALLIIVALVIALWFRHLRRARRAEAGPARGHYGIVPARPNQMYSDVESVRAPPPNEYEASHTPLRV
jgi:hypothetical protein